MELCMEEVQNLPEINENLNKTQNPDEDGIIRDVHVDDIECEDDNIEILGKNQEYSLTMYLDPNNEYKYVTKFVKAVERVVRGNKDYNLWLEEIRYTKNMTADAFFPNISSDIAEIQLHHYPYNLFTICEMIANDMLGKGLKVSTMTLADAVLMEHFRGNIGLVPLSVTNHELAHLDMLPIQRTQITGNWERFTNKYSHVLSDYSKSIIRDLLSRDSLELKETSPLLAISSNIEEILEEKNNEGEE